MDNGVFYFKCNPIWCQFALVYIMMHDEEVQS